MGNFIHFKSEEGFDVWINTNNITTFVMKECGDKITVAWTTIDNSGESCKIHKTTADKIKRILNFMASS